MPERSDGNPYYNICKIWKIRITERSEVILITFFSKKVKWMEERSDGNPITTPYSSSHHSIKYS